MEGDGKLRLLVKARGKLPEKVALQARRGLGVGAKSRDASFESRPLFSSIGERPASPKLATTGASAPQWSLLVSSDAVDDVHANGWDACHALLAGADGADIEFVEPDLVQRWPVDAMKQRLSGFGLRDGDAHPQNPAYKVAADPMWFRDAAHGGFASLGKTDPGDGQRVRIAHLDTGFDPHHSTTPTHLNVADARNFVDASHPEDAEDRSSGLLNNFSHGTGTLSILASSAFGCAPYADVIPIRVADNVVLFANSAIAQAMDYVHGLCRTPKSAVHVLTMSMGGLPSQAWAEAVNALYEAGVFIVTAAGNNYANAPTRFIVYPARFNRVVAACGVMADGTPYTDLAANLMAGNYGPEDKEMTAIAAYTPNVPWARFGAPTVVDLDGGGTSAATPQVAGAAALWIEKNRAAYDAYSKPWMRVEAVRQVLFESADKQPDHVHFGVGRLKADVMVGKRPPAESTLKLAEVDDAQFAFFKLFGMGLDGKPSSHAAMLGLELRQIVQAGGLETQLRDASGNPRGMARLVDAVLAKPGVSTALRKALGSNELQPAKREAKLPVDSARHSAKRISTADHGPLQTAFEAKVAAPPTRRLRVFAYDPSLATDPEMFGVNIATLAIPWEKDLQPGPVGEYLEVVDVDPPSHCCYAPVDLNHPHVLAQHGLAPSEANPQFHQQMVYAVAMRTIGFFERALGRRALWSSRYVRDKDGEVTNEYYVQRLRIYPHALFEENAFYTSDRMALLFGYFRAREDKLGTTLPGSGVFCAVSHDIIAHETTHALLDGLHRRYQEATNRDVLAFHEGFADLVALFQHFSMPESLLRQIQRTRGDLSDESLLGQIAVQFGTASGRHGSLRSAIGRTDKNGRWHPKPVKRDDYRRERDGSDYDPHNLGALLVSAVFAAFEQLYRARSADLIRLATSGTGVLPEGEISLDLTKRLAHEASKLAQQMLNICIRALDYCPPVDITFGEYLRAMITADFDLVPDDVLGYRVALIAAFRDRGIFPSDVAHLAEDSLFWEPPALTDDIAEAVTRLIERLDLRWNLTTDRQATYDRSHANAKKVSAWLEGDGNVLRDAMGFEERRSDVSIGELKGDMHSLEVHAVRPSRRTAPDGTTLALLVLDLTQTFRVGPDHKERYRGGCTLLIDMDTGAPRYLIRKRLRGSTGVLVQRAARVVAAEQAANEGQRYAPPGDPIDRRETFALLHRRAHRSVC